MNTDSKEAQDSEKVIEESKNSGSKFDFNNNWFVSSAVTISAFYILPRIGEWLSSGTGFFANYLNNSAFEIFKSSVIQDRSEYYAPLSLMLLVFLLSLVAVTQIFVLDRRGKGLRHFGNVLFYGGAFIFMTYQTVNNSAKSDFIEFKAAAICSEMDYLQFKNFQKSVYLAKSYSEVRKSIKSKSCPK